MDMEQILLISIVILLAVNLFLVLLKNNRKQTEELREIIHQEMKENREELGRSIRELRGELTQTMNLSMNQIQDTMHKNLMTTHEMPHAYQTIFTLKYNVYSLW